MASYPKNGRTKRRPLEATPSASLQGSARSLLSHAISRWRGWTLTAYRQIAQETDGGAFIDHFHQLLAYALTTEEWAAIAEIIHDVWTE